MERPQHPSVRARFLDGSYRSPFISSVTPFCTPSPEPEEPTHALALIEDRAVSVNSDATAPAQESISAPLPLGPTPSDAFYTRKGRIPHMSTGRGKAPRNTTIRTACRTGWKGYAAVPYDYLHSDEKFVDTVPVYAQRTRSSRRSVIH